jgi:hypothetical protein
MTHLASLKALADAVERGFNRDIPTPHPVAKRTRPELTARIIGYVQSYTVLRHKGASPFVMGTKDVLAHLRALIAQAEKGEA